jgi:hypothetical protein
MNLPPKRIEIMKLLHRYPILRAGQIRDRLLPKDDGANTRAHLRKCVAAEPVRKYQPRIVDPLSGSVAPPVYTLTCKGGSVLAALTGEPRFLIKAEPSFSSWMSVNHWCSLSALAMILDDAFAGKDYVRLTAMHFEHEVVDAGAKEPSKRYLLHTTVAERLYFCPDLAIETEARGYRRAWFIEYETGSDTPARVAAKKHKGVAGLVAAGAFKKAFPAARDFRVIAFCPNAAWRDLLREEFNGKPGAAQWLFCATPMVKKDTWLHEPLLYTVDEGPLPFMPRPLAPFTAGGAASGAEEGEVHKP